MAKITCVYRRTAEGRLALQFAADLFNLLKDGSGDILHVSLNPGLNDAARITTIERPIHQLIAEQEANVLAEATTLSGLSAGSIAISNSGSESLEGNIVVDHVLAFERADLDVLFPSREKTLLARGKGPLLVPFGDSSSAVPAANIAIAVAKRLTLPVVFYHTTWVDGAVESTRPEDHMCSGAIAVRDLLNDAAEKAGVEHSFVVETADDVAEGILHCAMRQSVRLIVMPRSAKTTIGCYVNQALAKTPVPLLAVAATPGRQQ